MAGRILIVDDEPAICEMIGFTLAGAGFEYDTAASANEAERKIADRPPDMILLDWMMPGPNGVELARRLSKDSSLREIPIIMLTAKDDERDMLTGFGAGVDDYVTKPFSPPELMARIRAVMRRAVPHATGEMLRVNGLALDPVGHRVEADGEELKLGPTEFRLLQFFMSHAERVYNRTQLIDLVWGPGVYIEERTVDVHIRRLREALAKGGYDRMIQTVRGAGYRFSNRD